MPDDLQIPLAQGPVRASPGAGRPSYRVDRPARGLDAGTRRLLAIAGLVLAVLLLAGGGWALLGRRSAATPVIEADSRPLRTKPDNPGGMQVAGSDEPDDAPATLAPPPEAPAPLALRAQVQSRAAAPAEPTPSAAAATSSAPQAAARTATPPATSRLPAIAGGPPVQLAALDSEDGARTEWARLQKRYPDLLGNRQPTIQRADKDGRAIWRIRTGGFADIADASSFCAKVRARGAGCSLATF